jgi:hypothetical protein
MLNGRLRQQVTAVGLLGMLLLHAGCHGRRTHAILVLEPLALWESATQRCVPEFPRDSAATIRFAVAVVKVEFAAEGHCVAAHILQAPDAATAASVEKCARAWIMPEADRTGPQRRIGKLFYYFVVLDRMPRVYIANDLSRHEKIVRDRVLLSQNR